MYNRDTRSVDGLQTDVRPINEYTSPGSNDHERRRWLYHSSHTTLAWQFVLRCAMAAHKLFYSFEDDWLGYPRWLSSLRNHLPETIYQPQCDGSGIAGRWRSALPQTSPPYTKLEGCDGGVHHCLLASGRNLILKRATYKWIIISITIISPLTEEAGFLLRARLSKLPSPRCLTWSCLSIRCRCRPSSFVDALSYEGNRRCPPCLIVLIVVICYN